jgi:hypothetical protein
MSYTSTPEGRMVDQKYWASWVIEFMWDLTMGLWQHRNQVLHGQTTQEQAHILLENVHLKARQLYQSFHPIMSSFLIYTENIGAETVNHIR